ncbi:hypothetical protein IU469_29985 [Nocardia puris]|uniref:Uncharacterized protein n=1 Tax=Nocardia puris TaxID=208602 RepID=A0A366D760_9NOCA|nr:hypothetical protein [Nocardia puris]MBF6215507.1 hypothetical protein [Nocardia puris]MBF6369910.1 hypothetical protein [Nocardia puris]RBO85329.1 hypothetical protein DFR74_115177 [Nocardia puris]
MTRLPEDVRAPLIELLGILLWLVWLLCIGRVMWVGGQLVARMYRDEAIEGLVGALSAAVLAGSASGIAVAILAT